MNKSASMMLRFIGMRDFRKRRHEALKTQEVEMQGQRTHFYQAVLYIIPGNTIPPGRIASPVSKENHTEHRVAVGTWEEYVEYWDWRRPR